jgi:hypothetical protein
VFGESLGRYYVENHSYPKQVYVLRIGSVRWPDEDHPYADAERGVSNGEWERGGARYEQEVNRMKATWLSRRDTAGLIEACLDDDAVTFGTFYGTSDNDRSWFDIGPARAKLGYSPVDSGDDWESPQSQESIPPGSAAHGVASRSS